MPAEQSAVSKEVPLKLDFQVQQVLSLIDAKLLFLAAGLQPAAALGTAIGVMFGWSFYHVLALYFFFNPSFINLSFILYLFHKAFSQIQT